MNNPQGSSSFNRSSSSSSSSSMPSAAGQQPQQSQMQRHAAPAAQPGQQQPQHIGQPQQQNNFNGGFQGRAKAFVPQAAPVAAGLATSGAPQQRQAIQQQQQPQFSASQRPFPQPQPQISQQNFSTQQGTAVQGRVQAQTPQIPGQQQFLQRQQPPMPGTHQQHQLQQRPFVSSQQPVGAGVGRGAPQPTHKPFPPMPPIKPLQQQPPMPPIRPVNLQQYQQQQQQLQQPAVAGQQQQYAPVPPPTQLQAVAASVSTAPQMMPPQQPQIKQQVLQTPPPPLQLQPPQIGVGVQQQQSPPATSPPQSTQQQPAQLPIATPVRPAALALSSSVPAAPAFINPFQTPSRGVKRQREEGTEESSAAATAEQEQEPQLMTKPVPVTRWSTLENNLFTVSDESRQEYKEDEVKFEAVPNEVNTKVEPQQRCGIEPPWVTRNKQDAEFNRSIASPAGHAQRPKYLREPKDAEDRSPDHYFYDSTTLKSPVEHLEAELVKLSEGDKQYFKIKSTHYDLILLVNMGDFYEIFDRDAYRILHDFNEYKFSVTSHQTSTGIAKIGGPWDKVMDAAKNFVSQGFKVGIVTQLTKAKKGSKELVQRGVTRIVTPGTLTHEFLTSEDDISSNYLLAITEKPLMMQKRRSDGGSDSEPGVLFGLSFVDCIRGETHAGSIIDDAQRSKLKSLLLLLEPREVIVSRNMTRPTWEMLQKLQPQPVQYTDRDPSWFWKDKNTILDELQKKNYFLPHNINIEQISDVDKNVLTSSYTPRALRALFQGNGEDDIQALLAFGALLQYLQYTKIDTRILSLGRILKYDKNNPLSSVTDPQTSKLDAATIESLEILRNKDGSRHNTLIEKIDNCRSIVGKHMLGVMLTQLSTNLAAVQDRQKAVNFLVAHQPTLEFIQQEILSEIASIDMDRIIAQINSWVLEKSQADDDGTWLDAKKVQTFTSLISALDTVNQRLEQVPRELLVGAGKPQLLVDILDVTSSTHKLDMRVPPESWEVTMHETPYVWYDLAPILDSIKEHIDLESSKRQDIIVLKEGSNTKEELDRIKKDTQDEVKKLNQKYGFKAQLGERKDKGQLDDKRLYLFQFELDNQQHDQLIAGEGDVERVKQNSKKSWYSSQRLRELSLDYALAHQRNQTSAASILSDKFLQLMKYSPVFRQNSRAIAMLDCLASLAQFCTENAQNLCVPKLTKLSNPSDHTSSPKLIAKDMINPLMVNKKHQPVPSDVSLGEEVQVDMEALAQDESKLGKAIHEELKTKYAQQINKNIPIKKTPLTVLMTGANMSGKSTYMKGICYLVILAQIGCHVPAKYCEMDLVDRIFTRIGASDRLMTGDSTFQMELQEVVTALNHATRESLVIIDEFGRGTSDEDGKALACGVVGHFNSQSPRSVNSRSRCIFATHFHPIILDLCTIPTLYWSRMKHRQTPGGIEFQYQVEWGVYDRSFGIECAVLAGLGRIDPKIIDVAKGVSARYDKEAHERMQIQRESSVFTKEQEEVSKRLKVQLVLQNKLVALRSGPQGHSQVLELKIQDVSREILNL